MESFQYKIKLLQLCIKFFFLQKLLQKFANVLCCNIFKLNTIDKY